MRDQTISDTLLQHSRHPTQLKRFLDEVHSDRSEAIFASAGRKYAADDPTVLRFQEALAERLTKEFPTAKTMAGVAELPGVRTNFYNLLTVTGYPMNPMGSAKPQNSPKGGEATRKEQVALVEEIIQELDFHYRPEPFQASKISRAGVPSPVIEPEWKMYCYGLGVAEARSIAELVHRGDFITLLSRHGVAFVRAITRRKQADAVTMEEGGPRSKPRTVIDFFGKEVAAEKSIASAPGHFRQRVRTAWAAPNFPTLALQALIFNPLKSWLMHNYGFTWTHRGPAHIAEKLAGCAAVVALDVSNYDQGQHTEVVETLYRTLPGIPDAHRALGLTLVRSPILLRMDYLGRRGHRFLGDPFDPATFDLKVGNDSGAAHNSLCNFLTGFAFILKLLRDVGMSLPRETWRQLLTGRHPDVRILNMGDDTLLGFTQSGLGYYQKLLPYLREERHPWFRIRLEDPAAFLGMIVCRGGPGKIIALPSLNSYFVNFLAPERPITHRSRRYWGFGYHVRKFWYSQNPAFRDADRLMQMTAKEVLGVTMDDLVGEGEIPSLPGELLNLAAVSFIEDPSVIHYKVDPRAVPRRLLEDYFLTIPLEKIEADMTKIGVPSTLMERS